MSKVANKKVLYTKIPVGLPKADEHFSIVDEQLDIKQVNLKEGFLFIQNIYASVDPYMRGRMRDPKVRSYVPAFKPNKVIDTLCISKVVKSADPKFPIGTLVATSAGCENYSIVKGKYCKIINDNPNIPLTYHLSLLGLPGQTAYMGLYKIGNPKAGETIFISGASGAVGQIVGQLAKIRGLRVIGSAGEDSKVQYLKDVLKFDGVFNYKKIKNLRDTLKELCPKGIDIYFDNVGGETLEVAMSLCNDFARIPLCGMISQYNALPGEAYPLRNLVLAIPRRIRLEGFIATDRDPKFEKMFVEDCTKLIEQKKLIMSESIDHGVENIPSSLINLFSGKNKGKQLVQLTSKL